MVGERYRSPGSSRGGGRKKQKRYHSSYPEPSPEPEKNIDSDIDSRSSFTASSRSSYYPPPARQHRNHNDENNVSRRRHDGSRSSRRSHRRKALTAPDEKLADTTVAIREDQAMQRVPRRQKELLSSDDETEVYDHRPRPVSHKSKSETPSRHQPQQRGDKDKGFMMTMAMVVVGLFVCFAEAD